MTDYVKFTEHNDWEGETWHFWIQWQGNGDALAALSDALNKLNEPELYELDMAPISESDVDVLVKHAEVDGYMANHNKLSGTLVIPDGVLKSLVDDESDDHPLYKGGIKDFVKQHEGRVTR